MPARIEEQRRLRELIAIVLDMLEHVDIEHRVESLGARDGGQRADPALAAGRQLAGARCALDLRDEHGVGLEAQPAPLRSGAEHLGRAADARADLEHGRSEKRPQRLRVVALPANRVGEEGEL